MSGESFEVYRRRMAEMQEHAIGYGKAFLDRHPRLTAKFRSYQGKFIYIRPDGEDRGAEDLIKAVNTDKTIRDREYGAAMTAIFAHAAAQGRAITSEDRPDGASYSTYKTIGPKPAVA